MNEISGKAREAPEPSLKLKTARTVKWNAIDRFGAQVIYLVVGVVLANVLSQDDFGLVGALLVFQAFAILFVDSGFGAALLRDKNPDEKDYSTVFWFNLGVSMAVYCVLWLCAPLIADIFQGDQRLIPLSKVMFLTFVINGLAIVQTNRLMKRMDVRQIAIANIVALTSSGVLGVALALGGYGAWALVWQSVANAFVKTAWLWATGHWLPTAGFHKTSMQKIWRIGLSVFSSSMLNTICLHIYSFVIGAFYSLASLGVYTQADKWSKMGSASISQILTASFVPLLSRVQDSREDFHRYMRKVNRFTSFILFPALMGLAVVGPPLFRTLFGNKWDEAIPLFQILAVRGIFVVFISLCGNYILALGKGRLLMTVEIIKDSLIFLAILATVFFHSVPLLVWGQLWASLLTWIIVLWLTSRASLYPMLSMLRDMAPFLIMSALMTAVCAILLLIDLHPAIILSLQCLIGLIIYISTLYISHTPELKEAVGYIFGRFP